VLLSELQWPSGVEHVEVPRPDGTRIEVWKNKEHGHWQGKYNIFLEHTRSQRSNSIYSACIIDKWMALDAISAQAILYYLTDPSNYHPEENKDEA